MNKRYDAKDIFQFRTESEPITNMYQIVIPDRIMGMWGDLSLSIALFKTSMFPENQLFNLEDFLEYQFENKKVEPELFLTVLENSFAAGQEVYKHPSGLLAHKTREDRFFNWVKEKRETLKRDLVANPLPDKLSHKFAVLVELGIFDHLRMRYFNSMQTGRTNTDMAKLIGAIIGEVDPAKIDSIRKCISGLDGKGKKVITKDVVIAVRRFLLDYQIELENLKE